MRGFARTHAATLFALAALLLVAAGESLLVSAPAGLPAGGSASPRTPLALPDPDDDQDLDGVADAADRTAGDLLLKVRLDALSLPGGHPFVLVGTQDDQGRTGAGAELEWTHIVDVDPLGRRAGSAAWSQASVRTGSWTASLPQAGEERAIADLGGLDNTTDAEGVTWPQELVLNVRDDRAQLRLEVELWDVDDKPFRLAARWPVVIDQSAGLVSAAGAVAAPGQTVRLSAGDAWLDLAVSNATEVPAADRLAIAQQWAPTVRFDADERFYPVRGDALERFHGIYRLDPNLQTWDLDFSNGRDLYRLLLADFDGDRRVDHDDAALMADVLATSPLAAPTLYANVATATNGALVVQYWMLYFYNFVVGEDDLDVAALAHDGDREFVQLEFADVEAARNGTPREVVFGRHYDGTRVSEPAVLFDDGAWSVYVARGSHATYPAPGDDRALRPALAGFFDTFDGAGATWTPGNYTVELLTTQGWHAGYLWGPATRFGRDLGTSARPLLQHDFRYPYTDPLFWSAALPPLSAEDAVRLFGGAR